MVLGLPFREIIALDFEFIAREGENPEPVCLVAKEVGTGRMVKLWQDQLGPEPPFEVNDDTLIVAYYASAEVGCFLALGWPVPTRIIDLYVEFRRETNALALAEGRGLLSALSRHHITRITAEEKKSGRDLVLRGGPWTDSERREILDYCETDVVCLPPLLEAMLPGIAATSQALVQALLRSRYTAAVARMERTGVPVDAETLTAIRDGWVSIKADLIRGVDAAMASSSMASSTPACSLSTSPITASRGPRLRRVACNLIKTHSAIKQRFTPSWHRCGSSDTHSASYGSKSWPSAQTDVTAPCLVRSAPPLAETLRVQISSSSVQACGYVA
jgi:hypothetical protein